MSAPVAETSYGLRLTQLAAARPEDADLAIVAGDGTEQWFTFAVLERRANQIARALEAAGVVQGDVVALALPTCIEHVLTTIAIWKLGATLLPLRYDIPAWETQRLLALAEPRVLVSDSPIDGCTTLTRTDLATAEALDDRPLIDRVAECVNLIASSGSTGRPKLIVVPYRGVVGDDVAAQRTKPTSRVIALVTSPLYHVNGFSYAAPLLLDGGRAIVMERFDARLAVQLIERHQVNLTVMVPTMLQRVARLEDVTPQELRTIERLVYGGAKIPDWVVDRWLNLIPPKAFVFTYGSSERVGMTMMTGEEWPRHRGSTGLPQDAVISIRDPAGNEVPAGEVGEIFMKPTTPRRMFEYVGAPTPAPTADGYYSIGDLGSVDADGYLYIADRRTDLIITGGANVFPAEVEAALSEHPAVADQVVVGVPDPEWGHRVHAIVQPVDAARPPTSEELREHCRARLAAYKVPKTYEVVERVPRSEAGKLNRSVLGAERGDSGRGGAT